MQERPVTYCQPSDSVTGGSDGPRILMFDNLALGCGIQREEAREFRVRAHPHHPLAVDHHLGEQHPRDAIPLVVIAARPQLAHVRQ